MKEDLLAFHLPPEQRRERQVDDPIVGDTLSNEEARETEELKHLHPPDHLVSQSQGSWEQ